MTTKLCILNTPPDTGCSSMRGACQSPALAGADYCPDHLQKARSCVVRYCDRVGLGEGRLLCDEHREEFRRANSRDLVLWLAQRANPHAARVESLRGSISLESIGIVVVFVVLALFMVSIFALFAGGALDDAAIVVLGALGSIGCLAFFAFLIAFDGKAKGGQCDGCLDGFDSDLLTPVDGGLFCNQCEEQARQDALLYKGAP